MSDKSYLGDAVYVAYDGFALVLTTENGISITNRIVLEPDVYTGLLAFVDRLHKLDARVEAPEES